MKTYRVNEIFYSLQGEGRMAGCPMVFLRFAGCNLRCRLAVQGFDCDTEFDSFYEMDAETILRELKSECPTAGWVLLTGGEPAQQIDADLIGALHAAGWKLAIETNGTLPLPDGLDWITCSPKSAEHTLRCGPVTELKYVRRAGQPIPVPTLDATYHSLSPAFQPDWTVRKEDLDHCVKLCLDHPRWSLSLQLHKLLGLR